VPVRRPIFFYPGKLSAAALGDIGGDSSDVFRLLRRIRRIAFWIDRFTWRRCYKTFYVWSVDKDNALAYLSAAWVGNTYLKERLSTIDLLIKAACFVTNSIQK